MKNAKKIFLPIATVFMFFSCQKYEEGPAISVTAKNERVANTWVVSQAMDNNEDVTESFDKYELFLTKDGDAELNAEYRILGETFDTETNGTWSFQNDKMEIRFDYEDDDYDNQYQILKLTKDEMWLRENGDDLEIHLMSK